jgi:UDP-N-acetylglucosamine--N-acetylmuramyl-(pentapeptide) pyrophosphoryl-undecaprenol N-acetylglucosamine transferase
VLHAAGRRDYDALRARLDELGSPPHYRLFPYVEPFADALAAADLAVARAGGSVFELAAAGLPSILVPYPLATGDHQEANARFMADSGAAVVIADAELDAPRLSREVGELLAAPQRMAELANAAGAVARPDAAERVAEELLRVADGGQ